MAFIGTPVVTQITDSVVRITGVSLANDTSGTIGLFGCLASPDIILPESFHVEPYNYLGTDIGVAPAVIVEVNLVSQLGHPGPIAVGKTGTTVQNFQISLAAGTLGDSEDDPPGLEIYIRYHQ
jgi:hypothetical protein